MAFQYLHIGPRDTRALVNTARIDNVLPVDKAKENEKMVCVEQLIHQTQ